MSSNSTALEAELSHHFRQHQTFKLDTTAAAAQVRTTGRLSLATSEMSFDLELVPHDMRAVDYRAEEIGADGVVRQVDTGPVRTFKGTARGTVRGEMLPQIGAARFTIDEVGIEGLIVTPAEHYFVEPARNYSKEATASDYVIYKKSDVVPSSSGSCGVTLSEMVGQNAEVVMPGSQQKIIQPIQTVAAVSDSVVVTGQQQVTPNSQVGSTLPDPHVRTYQTPTLMTAGIQESVAPMARMKTDYSRSKPPDTHTPLAAGCAGEPISSGQLLNRTLGPGCAFEDGELTDIFFFSGTAGQQVSITMTSQAFDTYLLLYFGPTSNLTFAAEDDNGAGGTNSRIPSGSGTFTLPATATYYIYATSQLPNKTGNTPSGFPPWVRLMTILATLSS